MLQSDEDLSRRSPVNRTLLSGENPANGRRCDERVLSSLARPATPSDQLLCMRTNVLARNGRLVVLRSPLSWRPDSPILEGCVHTDPNEDLVGQEVAR